MVDFDGGSVGLSMIKAYKKLKNPAFPRVSIETSKYPTPDSVYEAVRNGHCWAAIYATPGASDRLNDSLQARNNSTYNASDARVYI